MLELYRELADNSRRSLLLLLKDGPKNVSQLVEASGLKQPNISNHLGRLRSKGIVKAHKAGREAYYSLADEEVVRIVSGLFTTSEPEPLPFDIGGLAVPFARAATSGDEETCFGMIESAFKHRAPLLDIYVDLLSPAMAMVGEWYYQGAIDEAQEHVASEITTRVMTRSVTVLNAPARKSRTVVLGCGPHNWHVIGLRMISDFLGIQGWHTIFLGANTPTSAFVRMVEKEHPELVLVSCVAAPTLEESVGLIEALGQLKKTQPFTLGMGGPCACENRAEFAPHGVDFFAGDLRQFAHLYDRRFKVRKKRGRPRV